MERKYLSGSFLNKSNFCLDHEKFEGKYDNKKIRMKKGKQNFPWQTKQENTGSFIIFSFFFFPFSSSFHDLKDPKVLDNIPGLMFCMTNSSCRLSLNF